MKSPRTCQQGSGQFHRLVRLLWAYFRCEIYLLRAMWRGECMLTGYGEDGRIALIAATSGNIFDNTLAIKRIFYTGQQPNARTQLPRE